MAQLELYIEDTIGLSDEAFGLVGREFAEQVARVEWAGLRPDMVSLARFGRDAATFGLAYPFGAASAGAKGGLAAGAIAAASAHLFRSYE